MEQDEGTNTIEVTTEDATSTNNNINMQEETNTNQVMVKDAKVSELLNGINTFLDNIKNSQVGGGNSVIANERAKIAKLFNVLSIEDLLKSFQDTSTTVSNSIEQTNETPQ
jgi:hypothetical protein